MSSYTPEEFDNAKTQVMKYILYKKRTESEVRTKFCHTIEENMLDDIIEYIKEAGYINDKEYIKKIVNEYMNLKSMSIREIKEYELNSAKKLAQKKKGADEQKIKNYLFSKGFDIDVVGKVLNSKED